MPLSQRTTSSSAPADASNANSKGSCEERYDPSVHAAQLSGLPVFIIRLLNLSTAIASYTWVCFSLTALWVTLPLVLLDPFIVKMGLDSRFFPYEYITKWWAQSVTIMGGSWPQRDGMENVDTTKTTIYCCNHLSSSDTIAACGMNPTTPKLIFKRELMFYFPWMFVVAMLMHNVPVNRKNREEALKAMEEAEYCLTVRKYPLFFFVEGTRSRTGQLREFKKGAFHMAKKTGVSISPVIISGSYRQWPPWTMLPVPGKCKMTWLRQIPVEEEDTADTLLEKTRKAMEDFQAQDDFQFTPTPVRGAIPGLVWNLACIICGYGLYSYFMA